MNSQNMIKMSINLTSNYNNFIKNELNEIIDGFVSILEEYIVQICDKPNVKLQFIIEGIKTITHVYTLLFYYTKNLELTNYHSKKAYGYYIDFIEQKNGENYFQNLTYRDAIIFVYRKTIYQTNNIHRLSLENTTNDKYIFNIMNLYKIVYKNTLIYMLKKTDFYSNKQKYVMQWKKSMMQINLLNLDENNLSNLILFISMSNKLSIDDYLNNIVNFKEIMI
jgi:hypothetical protein